MISDRDTKALMAMAAIDDRLKSIPFEGPSSHYRSKKQGEQTRQIKGALREVGRDLGYTVRESAKEAGKELLWDMVWLSLDEAGDIVDFPLACEIELIPTQAAVEEDLRKLLLANSALKVLVCRTRAFFNLQPYLQRSQTVRNGDLWYAAHFGPPDHEKRSRGRPSKDERHRHYFAEWDSSAYRYPYFSYGSVASAVWTLLSPKSPEPLGTGRSPSRDGWSAWNRSPKPE